VNSVKRKLLTKKKSLELSFENIKILKNRGLTQTPSTKQNDKLISSSTSEYTLLNKSVEEEVKIINNNNNDDFDDDLSKNNKLDETNNSIKNETKEVDLNKLFPDTENEFVNYKELKIEQNNKYSNWLIKNKYKILFISIIIYYLINNSSFLNGLILGTSITGFISYFYLKLNYKNIQHKEIVDETQQQKHDYNNKLIVLEKSDKNFCGVYKVSLSEEVYEKRIKFYFKGLDE
jgi:hypothetical protein